MKPGWEVKKLGDVIQRLETVDPRKEPDKPFKYIDVSSISRRTLAVSEVTELLGSSAPSRARRRVRSGDIIFATIRPTLKRIAYIGAEHDQAVCSTGYMVLRANSGLHARYIYYFLQSADFSAAMEGLQKGASYPAVTDGEIRSQKIPLPPLEEQHRIVSILDKAFEGLDRARENAEANLESARELFETSRSSIFAGLLGTAPLKQLGDLCSRVSVGHVGETSKHYVKEGGIPFIRSQNVRPTGIELKGAAHITHDFHQSLKKSQLFGGELLFVRVGANRGHCCSLPNGFGELNCANIVFGRPEAGNVHYLEHYCQSKVGQENLLGMTTGSAQGVINTKSVAKLTIPIPEDPVQASVVNKLDKMRDQLSKAEANYRAKLQDISDLRQSLLQKAFAGELT